MNDYIDDITRFIANNPANREKSSYDIFNSWVAYRRLNISNFKEVSFIIEYITDFLKYETFCSKNN